MKNQNTKNTIIAEIIGNYLWYKIKTKLNMKMNFRIFEIYNKITYTKIGNLIKQKN